MLYLISGFIVDRFGSVPSVVYFWILSVCIKCVLLNEPTALPHPFL